jgi:hypothetical protein
MSIRAYLRLIWTARLGGVRCEEPVLRRVFKKREVALLAAAEEKGRLDGLNAAKVFMQRNWERRPQVLQAIADNDPGLAESLPAADPITSLDRKFFTDDREWIAACERYGWGHAEAMYRELLRLASIED